METEQGKQQSQNKRRERALYIRCQYEKQNWEDEDSNNHNDNHSDSSPKSSNHKLPRPKPKKGKKSMFEEDIIDGFAIMSFKTLEELESVAKRNGCINDEKKEVEEVNGKDIFDKDENAKHPKKFKKNTTQDNSGLLQNGECSDSGSSSKTGYNNIKSPANNHTKESSTIPLNENMNNFANKSDAKSHAPLQSNTSQRSEELESKSIDNSSPFKLFRKAPSNDIISDCELENDHETSESSSQFNSGLPNRNILSHLPTDTCLALTAPTPPPSLTSTPTPVYNPTVVPDKSNPPPAVGDNHSLFSPHTSSRSSSVTSVSSCQAALAPSNFNSSFSSAGHTSPSSGTHSVIHPCPSGRKQSHTQPLTHNNQLSQDSQHLNNISTHTTSQPLSNSSEKTVPSSSYPLPLRTTHIQPCNNNTQTSTTNNEFHPSQPPPTLPSSSSHDPSKYLKSTKTSHNGSPYLTSRPNSVTTSSHNYGLGVIHSSQSLSHTVKTSGEPDKYHRSYVSSIQKDANNSPSSSLNVKKSPLPDGTISGTLHDKHNRSYGSSLVPHPPTSATQKSVQNRQTPTSITPGIAISTSTLITTTATKTPTSSCFSSLNSTHLSLHQNQYYNPYKQSSHSSYSIQPGQSPHHPQVSHHHSQPPSSSSSSKPQYASATPIDQLHQLSHTFNPTSLSQPQHPLDKTSHSRQVSPHSAERRSSQHQQFKPPLGFKQESPVGSSSGDRDRKFHPSSNVPRPSDSNSQHYPVGAKVHPYQHLKEREDKEKEKEQAAQFLHGAQSLPKSTFTPPSISKSPWSSSPSSLFSPIQLHPHPLGAPLNPGGPAAPSLTPHSSSIFPAPLAPPPPLLAVTGGASSHSLSSGMFATPLPPAPITSLAGSLTNPHAVPGPLAAEGLIRNHQDFLHQDLNNRLLAQRDPVTPIALPTALPATPYIRGETHQHQHQHLHNHMHQHNYGINGIQAQLVPPATPLFDKIPKAYEPSIFRPSILPSYNVGFSNFLPPTPSGIGLSSSLQGAFQPKSLVQPGPLLVPQYRDRDSKAVSAVPMPATPKKQGKWCAQHVKIAWEIYQRQQKTPREGEGLTKSEVKPLEPLLRPSSHLVAPAPPPPPVPAPPPPQPGVAIISRPAEISPAAPSSLLSAGVSPYPRASPYAPPPLLNSLGFSGLGNSMFAPVKDIAASGPSLPPPAQTLPPPTQSLPPHAQKLAPPGHVPSLAPPGQSLPPSRVNSSPHDWNRLRRTPSSFPSWPSVSGDKERDRERDLRKEEERERESKSSLSHRRQSVDESRHIDHGESSSRPKSRSRSRSPLVNGRLDLYGKPELSLYDSRRFEDKPPSRSTSISAGFKLKEEEHPQSIIPNHILERDKFERERQDRVRQEQQKRLELDHIERLEKEKLLQSVVNAERTEREKLIHAEEQRHKLLQSGGYLGISPFSPAPGLNMLERRVGGLMAAPGSAFPFMDRPTPPTSMWSPYDKSAVELSHRYELERERAAVMSRLASVPHLAAIEQERQERLREQQEIEFRRQYMDRLPQTLGSVANDRLRMADQLALGGYFKTLNPMFPHMPLGNGIKSNTTVGLSSGPPPLIPSSASASMSSLGHPDNAPSSSSKIKTNPPDSTTDVKDKRDGLDRDPHSR